jgi:hypothetical protein
MKPTPGDVHVNRPLTNISIAYFQNAANFVASRVFPNIPVDKQSDMYFQYDRGEFNRDEMRERAPGTESEGGGYTIDSTPTYFARRYSFHKDIPDEVRANADQPLSPDREATTYVSHKALIRREKLFVNNYFRGGVWTGGDIDGVASSPSGGNVLQWNDAASNPIEDVRRGKRVIAESTGFEPNKLVLGRPVYDTLVDHPDIVDRIKYGQTPGAPAMVSKAALAALFEVEEVLVMNSIENTAAEGRAPSHSFIGGKRALLCYSTPTPGIMTPTAGYTFSWRGLFGAGDQGTRIRQFRLERQGVDRVEIDLTVDMKLVGADLGYFFDTIVA